MELIEDVAQVVEVSTGRVKVNMLKPENCEGCAAHGFCTAGDKTSELWISTDLLLNVGDHVRVFISPALRVVSSIIIFLLPVILMLVFYLLAKYLFHTSENLSILISVLSLGVSGLIIWQLDRKWGKQVHYEIIEKISEEVIADENQTE